MVGRRPCAAPTAPRPHTPTCRKPNAFVVPTSRHPHKITCPASQRTVFNCPPSYPQPPPPNRHLPTAASQPHKYDFCFCKFPFMYDPGSKARLLQMENQMSQVGEGLCGCVEGGLWIPAQTKPNRLQNSEEGGVPDCLPWASGFVHVCVFADATKPHSFSCLGSHHSNP